MYRTYMVNRLTLQKLITLQKRSSSLIPKLKIRVYLLLFLENCQNALRTHSCSKIKNSSLVQRVRTLRLVRQPHLDIL